MDAAGQTRCENMTENCGMDQEFVFEDYTQRIIIGIVLSFVSLAGLIGNSLVVLSVIFSHKLRSATNWFVVNLGIADFLTCLFLPFNVLALVVRSDWPLAPWVCSMTGAIILTCPGTSIITLALIAFNRWYLITQSRSKFQGVYTTRNIVLMISFSWIYPFLLLIIPHLAGLGQLGYSAKYKTCQQDTTVPTSDYYSLIAGVGVIIPVFFAIVIIYARIYRFIFRHNKERLRSFKSERLSTSLSQDGSGVMTSQDRKNITNDDNSTLPPPCRETPSLCGRRSVLASMESLSVAEVKNCVNAVFPPVHLELKETERSEIGNERATDNHIGSTVDDPTCRPTHVYTKNRSVSRNIPSTASSSTVSRMTTPVDKFTARIMRQQIIITKRLALVVLVFFLCLLPFGICVVVPPSDPAIPWVLLLVYTNSCINPVIYAATMPTFRQVMGHIACCRYEYIPERHEFIRPCRTTQVR